jgi:hypothetical protein
MRKHTSFAVATMILGLSTMFWIKSSVVATGADDVRPKAGLANYVVMPSLVSAVSDHGAHLLISVVRTGRDL